ARLKVSFYFPLRQPPRDRVQITQRLFPQQETRPQPKNYELPRSGVLSLAAARIVAKMSK
ncbi:MAG TPA: hypothetical protein VMM76_25235, partial [Pirellulaceae bacterium]|nr:hypothetical protein [Pirellulaceae bacterium]